MKSFLVICSLAVLASLAAAAPATLEDKVAFEIEDMAEKHLVNLRPARSLETVANITANIIKNVDIATLRRLCPALFQVIDNVIQNVTSTVFRVVGRAVLQSGGLGGGDNSERKVSVVLPTFGPIDDDDEDEDEDTESTSSQSANLLMARFNDDSASTTTNPPTTIAENAEIVKENTNTEKNTTTDTDTTTNEAVKEEFTSPSVSNEVIRRKRDSEDQDVAASGGNAPNPVDASGFDDEADRDKRFLPFGGSVSGHAGSAGGSGNFLFDIIRRTADGAARAAGTVYRMVAGTDNLGFGLSSTSTSTRTLASQLVAGSGASEATDEKDNAPVAGAGGVAEIDVAAKGGDGYTEGIPGPITRLFVLANRGLANLVQDLILRLAQTSERIVNFKARLVTSLI